MPNELPAGDDFLGNVVTYLVVTYLIEGDEREAALMLLGCQCQVELGGDRWDEVEAWSVRLGAPRRVSAILKDENHPLREVVHSATSDVVAAYGHWLRNLNIVARLANPDSNWREEMLQVATGKDIHNQAANAEPESVRVWNYLRFRSQTEVRVAQALDSRGVMFFPNCKARLTTPVGRRNKEPDFLVCFEGKWGILEVDGELFHPPSRTTEDHARDRLFKEHGVRLVEHFDANECYENADSIVDRFFKLLARS